MKNTPNTTQETEPPASEVDVKRLVMQDKFIKLKKSETLINLSGVSCVRKLDEVASGNNWHKSRIILVNYQNGESCRLFYGSDDTYHHENQRGKQRDSDYRQIEKSILV